MARGRGPNSFFYMWVSSCPSAIFFLNDTKANSYNSCQKSINHRCMGFFLDSPPGGFSYFILCLVTWMN